MMIRSGAKDGVLELGTGAQAHVATLTVRAGTEVALEAATGRDVFVRVRNGEVDLAVDHRRDDQRFAVLAGGFRVQVVGTRFSVRHGADASVSVDVREGAVRIDAADVATAPTAETLTVVRAGQRWQARGGRISFGPIEAATAGAEPILPSSGASDAAIVPAIGAPADVVPASDPSGDATRAAAHTTTRARAQSNLPGPPALPDLNAAAGSTSQGADRALATQTPPGSVATQGKGPAQADGATRPDTTTPRRFLIEVPPQRMSADEIERAHASERAVHPLKAQPDTPRN